MVQPVAYYSNRLDLCDELGRSVDRLAREQAKEAGGVFECLSVRSQTPPRTWRVVDRLSTEEMDKLMESYRTGTPMQDLITRYGLSKSTIKRHLRERGVKRSKE